MLKLGGYQLKLYYGAPLLKSKRLRLLNIVNECEYCENSSYIICRCLNTRGI